MFGAVGWLLVLAMGLALLFVGSTTAPFVSTEGSALLRLVDSETWLAPNLGWIARLFPYLLVSILLPLSVWFAITALWFPFWLPGALAWVWISMTRILGRRTRPRPTLLPLPRPLREWGAASVFLIGLSSLFLALLQIDPIATKQVLDAIRPLKSSLVPAAEAAGLLQRLLDGASTLLQAVRAEFTDLAHGIDVAFLVDTNAKNNSTSLNSVLGALVAVVSVSAAIEAASKIASDFQITSDQRKLLARVGRRVRVHVNLVHNRLKLVVIGSTPKEQAQKVTSAKLLEIWLGLSGYNFDAIELLNVIDSRMDGDIDECDVVVVVGKSREVVAHETLEHFRELLVGGTEDKCDPGDARNSGSQSKSNELAIALADCDRDVLRRLLDPNTVSTNATNFTTAAQMIAKEKKRILVLDRDDRYIGFCNLEELVHEVFG
jgi:hypothetical protein